MTSSNEDAARDQELREERLAALLLARHQQLLNASLDKSAENQIEAVATPPADAALEAELLELTGCLQQLEEVRRKAIESEAMPETHASPGDDPTWPRSVFASAGGEPMNDQVDAPAGRIGRFEIVRELGRGGLGVVLLAHDPVLDRRVAIKIPRPEAMFAPQLRQRFTREAQAASRLTHPNIVPIYDAGEIGPVCIIAAAFVDGPSLAEWLKERSTLPEPRLVARLVAELADAMDYAHAQGILHRDLKPSNVLLEPAAAFDSSATIDAQFPWTPKITDFGLAKITDLKTDDTRTGAIIGTPAYMSPEQAHADHACIGPGADIYSLGAMLYELVTGRPPFCGKSDAETLNKLTTEEPVAPHRVNAQVPRDLEAICLRCLERSPDRRYRKAGDMAADLRRFLTGEPTVARPLSNVQRAVRWAGRNRRVAALLGTVAGLLLCITAVSTIAAIRVSRARDEAQQTAAREREAREQSHLALMAEQVSLDKAQASERQAIEEQAKAETQAVTAANVSDFLVNLFMTADPLGVGKLGFREPSEIGADLTLRTLLDRGSQQARRALQEQPIARASLLDTLGKVYANLGLFDRAEPLVREAYELRMAHPENEIDMAASLLNMGAFLRWQGEYGESERLLRRALELRTRIYGEQTLAVADAEIALAWTLFEGDRFGAPDNPERPVEFDKLAKHALAVQQRLLGSSHREVGITLMVISLRQFAMRNQQESEKTLLQAMTVLTQQEGGQSLAYVLLDFQRAARARQQRQYAKAETHYRAALDMCRKVLGRANPLSIGLAADLGGMFRDMGRMDDFEELAVEASDTRPFPHGHPMFIEAIREWFGFVASQGKFDQAVELVTYLNAIENRFYGFDPLRNVHRTFEIAGFRIDQGRLDEASTRLEQVETPPDASEADRRQLAASLDWHRGVLAGARGELATQEHIWRDCILAFESHGLPTVSHKLALADVIQSQRADDPEVFELAAAPDLRLAKGLSPSYPHAIDPYLLYARMLIEHGKLAEAEPFISVAHEFTHQKTIRGNYRIGYADSLMGAWLAAKGQPAEAEPLLIAGLDNLRLSRGDHHRLTHEACDRLVNFYRQAGREADAAHYAELLPLRPTDRSEHRRE